MSNEESCDPKLIQIALRSRGVTFGALAAPSVAGLANCGGGGGRATWWRQLWCSPPAGGELFSSSQTDQ